MLLPKEAIAEYKKIYKKHFGVELDDKDATENAESLLMLFRVIYRPLPNIDNSVPAKIQSLKNG